MGTEVLGREVITGAFWLFGASEGLHEVATIVDRSSNEAIRNLVVILVFTLIFREWIARNSIFPINPFAEIDELTPFGTERAKKIIFPDNRFIAGGAFHGCRR